MTWRAIKPSSYPFRGLHALRPRAPRQPLPRRRHFADKPRPDESAVADAHIPASLDQPVGLSSRYLSYGPDAALTHENVGQQTSIVRPAGALPKNALEGNSVTGNEGVQWSSAPVLKRHAQLLRNIPHQPVEVAIEGLVRSIRKQKKIAFAQISDGTTLASLQAVLTPEQAKDINNGSAVRLHGTWKKSQGSGQSHELEVVEAVVLGDGDPAENPLQKQAMSNDHLRTILHLRMRTQFQSLLTRVRSHLMFSVHQHFAQRAYMHPVFQVHPPLITSSDCEGAGEVFTLSPRTALPDQAHYFREPKYMTVSSQLHLEAYAAELGNVYALSPTFRAEESDTSRHLAEFYMLEAEYRFSRLENVLSTVEHLLRDLCHSLRDHTTGKELLTYWERNQPGDGPRVYLTERWERLNKPFVRITYTDAVRALSAAFATSGNTLFEHPPTWENGLQLEHERWIVENLSEGRPTIVTHYPKAIKPFYMRTDPSPSPHGEVVECFDVLFPFGSAEVVGGSMREDHLERLVSNMREKGLLKAAQDGKESEYPFLQPGESLGGLRWYADLRRYGSSPHGGWGAGFDRLVGYLTGVANLRDVVGFPRYYGRADC